MNDFSILKIKKNLEGVINFFEPGKLVYTTINNCINSDFTAEQMMVELSKIGSTNDYPEEFQNFFYDRFNELKLLAEKDREIQYFHDEIKMLNLNLSQEFAKRGIDYNAELVLNDNYKDLSYSEKKEYLSICRSEREKLLEKVKAVNLEKESGQAFDEKLGSQYDNSEDGLVNNYSQINKIQNDSSENRKMISNPALNTVMNYINNYRENQQEQCNLNVKIVYDNNSGVTLTIGFKGSIVDEKYPLIECYYSDETQFNKDIYPALVEDHVIDGGVNGYDIQNGNLESENINGEGLEIQGNSNVSSSTQQYLDAQVVEKEKVKNLEDKKVKVRVRELDTNAFANGIIVFISLVVVIIVVLLILFLL